MSRIDPQKHIQVHMVTSGELTSGWVHSHGMNAFDLPEIEIRGVPTFMMFAAGVLVNEVCDYLLNSGKKVELGQTMRVGRDMPFRFEKLPPIPGDEGHYQVERWTLVDLTHKERSSTCQVHR